MSCQSARSLHCLAALFRDIALTIFGKIANDFDITKRRKFYDIAHELADEYYMDRIIEEDLLHSTWARTTFKRAIVNGSKLGRDLEEIFTNRSLFSMWNEPISRARAILRKSL
jgi:hypothetical protein